MNRASPLPWRPFASRAWLSALLAVIAAPACSGDSDGVGSADVDGAAPMDGASPADGTIAVEGADAAADAPRGAADSQANGSDSEPPEDATLPREAGIDASVVDADTLFVDSSPVDSSPVDAPDHDALDAAAGDAASTDADGRDADDAAESGAEEASVSPIDGGGDGDPGGDSDDAEPDGGSLNQTERLILTERGAACLSCAESSGCVDAGSTCDDVSGNATEGPAAGQAGEGLCLDLLKCELDTLCFAMSVTTCICGNVAPQVCFGAAGPQSGSANNCTAQEAAALETTSGTTSVNRQSNPAYPGGIANNVAVCLDNNCDDCVE